MYQAVDDQNTVLLLEDNWSANITVDILDSFFTITCDNGPVFQLGYFKPRSHAKLPLNNQAVIVAGDLNRKSNLMLNRILKGFSYRVIETEELEGATTGMEINSVGPLDITTLSKNYFNSDHNIMMFTVGEQAFFKPARRPDPNMTQSILSYLTEGGVRTTI